MGTWPRFIRQAQCDVRLWLFAMGALSLYRATFLVVFRNHMLPDSGRRDVLLALVTGLLFDALPATLLALPSFLMSILCGLWDLESIAQRVRMIVGMIFCAVTPFLCCVAIEYFREYRELFDQVLFAAYDDDHGILLETIYSDYHLVRYLLLCVLLSTVSIVVLRRWIARPLVSEQRIAKYSSTYRSRLAICLMLLTAIVIGLRNPQSPKRTAAVSIDPLINKAVINPYMALYYAAKINQELRGAAALMADLPDERFAAAARQVFPAAPVGDDLDLCLLRSAAGPRNVPPKHIFVVGMESYDAWPLMDEYRSLDVTNNLRRFGREGLHVKSFLPSGQLSIVFCASVIAGLPEAGVPITRHQAAAKPFPTALPETLRKLGYRTRFFCGSLTSWQSIDKFCPSQGFDEVYGSFDFVRGTRFEGNKSLWGSCDEALFDFVASKINDDEPSFSFIFTSSYHPPYVVDLEAERCPLKQVPEDLKDKCTVDTAYFLRAMGHLWYADRCLGQFVDSMQAKLSRPLFAFTGDHYGRHFINSHPTLYERSAVPLVLYGPEVLRGIVLPPGVAGGHIDICPTIIELAAPRGFQYHAFGQNLLAPQRRFFGYGSGKVIGHDFLVDLRNPEQLCPIPGGPLPQSMPDVAELGGLYNSICELSWWRVERGPKLHAHIPAGGPDIAPATELPAILP